MKKTGLIILTTIILTAVLTGCMRSPVKVKSSDSSVIDGNIEFSFDSIIELVVPDFRGKSLTDLESDVQYKGYFVFQENKSEWSETIPEGQIIDQVPAPGTVVNVWDTPVYFTVSKGTSHVNKTYNDSDNKSKDIKKIKKFIGEWYDICYDHYEYGNYGKEFDSFTPSTQLTIKYVNDDEITFDLSLYRYADYYDLKAYYYSSGSNGPIAQFSYIDEDREEKVTGTMTFRNDNKILLEANRLGTNVLTSADKGIEGVWKGDTNGHKLTIKNGKWIEDDGDTGSYSLTGDTVYVKYQDGYTAKFWYALYGDRLIVTSDDPRVETSDWFGEDELIGTNLYDKFGRVS